MRWVNRLLYRDTTMLAAYIQMYRRKIVTYHPGRGFHFDWPRSGMPHAATFYANLMGDPPDLSMAIEFYTEIQIKGAGPKVFTIDNDHRLTFEQWENIEVRLKASEFVAPFPCTIIELPDNYIEKRAVTAKVTDPKTGEAVAVATKPVMAAVVWVQDPVQPAVICCVFNDKDEVWSILMYGEETLEEHLVALKVNGWRPGSLTANPEEADLSNRVTRAALNACLFFCEPNTVVTGKPANESHHARLTRRGQHHEAKRLPWVYKWSGFDDRRFRTVRIPVGEVTSRDGTPVSPHWRHGHWTMQPFGPMTVDADGRKHWKPENRRRTFRKALLVMGGSKKEEFA